MSNRLDQEFPQIAWRVPSPLPTRGLPVEVTRAHMERARALRRRVVRRSVRREAAGFRDRFLAAVTYVQRTGHGLFKAHARDGDCCADRCVAREDTQRHLIGPTL